MLEKVEEGVLFSEFPRLPRLKKTQKIGGSKNLGAVSPQI
jgi:hypothetical protein